MATRDEVFGEMISFSHYYEVSSGLMAEKVGDNKFKVSPEDSDDYFVAHKDVIGVVFSDDVRDAFDKTKRGLMMARGVLYAHEISEDNPVVREVLDELKRRHRSRTAILKTTDLDIMTRDAISRVKEVHGMWEFITLLQTMLFVMLKDDFYELSRRGEATPRFSVEINEEYWRTKPKGKQKTLLDAMFPDNDIHVREPRYNKDLPAEKMVATVICFLEENKELSSVINELATDILRVTNEAVKIGGKLSDEPDELLLFRRQLFYALPTVLQEPYHDAQWLHDGYGDNTSDGESGEYAELESKAALGGDGEELAV